MRVNQGYSTDSRKVYCVNFNDQFTFRPTGSTTAALISILHTITQLLTTHQYVVVIALDFSKAFDTVRYYTLLSKMAELEIPDKTSTTG